MSPSRVVLVTGCSSGIGSATAHAFHKAGWTVYATARRTDSLTGLREAGATTLALDVTDEESMRDAVDKVEAVHGAVDVLVNNAGYAMQGPIEEADLDDVRRQFETNVFGMVRMAQLVLPAMRARGRGRIVNVSSMGGRFTFPGGGFYHASKHAVVAISDALRMEVASFGVRVSLVEPGPVLTEFANTAIGELAAEQPSGAPGPYDDFKRRLAATYAGAYDGRRTNLASSPERVARTILKAARARSPRSRYVVGPIGRALVTSRRVLPDTAFDALIRSRFPTP